MKKLIYTLLILIFFAGFSQSQMKMNFSLSNPRDSAGYFMYDLKVTVLSGQVWHIGASNIRVTDSLIVGTGSFIPKGDNPALNAFTGGYLGYMPMTTTPIASNTGLSCNILFFNTSGFLALNPGTYILCSMRWTKTLPLSYIGVVFRVPPTSISTVIYDSTVLLTYGINYTVTNPAVLKTNNITAELPMNYNLYQNYPNPFNPTTKIRFEIANTPLNHLSRGEMISLKVFDITGKEIATLVNERLQPGTYEVTFDASMLTSGIYFYRLETTDFVQTNKMILLK